MIPPAGSAAPSDAELAIQLFLTLPSALPGVVLTGGGPVRDAIMASAEAQLAARGPVRRVPASIDRDRLLGGLDLAATLAAGHGVHQPGLLREAAGGTVILPMAERALPDIAAPIAQAMDGGGLAAMLLDDGMDADEAPPAMLTERIPFHCRLDDVRSHCAVDVWPDRIAADRVMPPSDAQRAALAGLSLALGITSARPMLFAQSAAIAHAALHGRTEVEDDDLTAAVRLVLAPRALNAPAGEPDAGEAPPPADAPPADPQPDGSPDADGETDNEPPMPTDRDLEEILLAAAAAALPRHVLDQDAGRLRIRGKGRGGRAGKALKSARRGRPLGARAGMPGDGRRLALIETLRAAIPWQRLRRDAARPGDGRLVHLRKSDLRVRAFQERQESLTIFAVDASGSSALARLAEAKGAVEMMLAEAYVKRAQVALIAFRHHGAEVLLPPTRSLTRARRALAGLPGGGGTPLAAGLIAAEQLAEAAIKRGQSPIIALLTDGKGNVALDGTANRAAAMAETATAAASIARAGIPAIVIDISPRPRAEASELAAMVRGRYLPLPHAGSAAMVAAIDSIGRENAA
ncbi:VWA domain-containing protein [Sphingomonas sp. FW199]|uniref:VWA domain-containing protein n=1 Tax=Sphingomonas sp. FW199 TaxID=3400217 RepID=UPI003CF37448